MKILVLGKTGQLALEFQKILGTKATFISKEEFQQDSFDLDTLDFDFLINCFAYTQVDNAEIDVDECYQINAFLPQRLAQITKNKNAKFVHFSTDYVFDGFRTSPYDEETVTNPSSIYGKSKESGEKLILEVNPHAIIFRTSWLHGHGQNNFIYKIHKKINNKEAVNVVYDQIGSLTLAYDLAKNICDNLELIKLDSGIFHYSGSGICSWFDIAFYLAKSMNKAEFVKPVLSIQFESKVKRPHYSVLNNDKVKAKLNFYQRHWMDSVDKLKGEYL